MKAILLESDGALLQRDIPAPVIKEGEVLVATKCISINPVDVKTRNGRGVYGRIKDDAPVILGWDISGVVEQSQSPLFKPGEEVFGMVNFPGHGRAYAAYVAAPAAQLALKPANISHEAAAAATLAALTAYQSLVKQANLTNRQNVLIHAAAGGVGHFAVQIARQLGAAVVGTASAINKDFVLSLGAVDCIDYHNYQWQHLQSRFDFVLDTIGGENIDHSLLVTQPGGSLISIPSGLNELVAEKAKEKGVQGSTFMVSSNGDDMKVIADWLGRGLIKPFVSAIYDFAEMDKAHAQIQSGRTVGKVVVRV